MRRSLVLAATVLLAGCLARSAASADPPASPAPAPVESVSEPQSTISWEITGASRYSFQGIDYSDGGSVLQPQVSGQIRGISLGIWANADQARREINEIDLTLQAEWNTGPWSGAFGYANLQYPHRDWEPTHELLAGLGLEAPLNPSLGVHWDVAAGQGRYWTFGLDHEIPWRGAGVGFGVKLYAHDHYYGISGIPALETGISLSSPVGVVMLRPALLRMWTWENGGFRDEEALPASWVLSVTLSSR